MDYYKRNTKILIVLVICIIAIGVCVALGNLDTKVYAMQSTIQMSNFHTLSDIILDTEIEDEGYLYNYDDSIDYIYIDFIGSKGYVILLEETLEIVEYATQGEFPYKNIEVNKYYGGPNAYFVKNGKLFQDILTDKTFEYSDNLIYNKAVEIRRAFSVQSKSIAENIDLLKNKSNRLSAVYQLMKHNIIQETSTIGGNSTANTVSVPPYDKNNPISPTAGAQYIENVEYFITPNEYPRYGNNTNGTCVTVAAQLLLSYNNYYNDRRIIDNMYLFGNETNNPEDNPNYCQDPEKITSETIGSTQSFHDMLLNNYNIVTYYADAKTGLEAYLRDQNVSGNINLNSNSSGSLNQNIVITELDAGRPIIVGTKSELAGVTNFNHAMVAYGYESFAAYSSSGDNTVYTGYIVNFGWDPYGTGYRAQVWTNASWFNVSVSMDINHIHEYTTIDTIEDDCIKICKCYCGHREVVSTRRHIFNDFGYKGSTYSWKGLVEMRFAQGNKVNYDDVLIIENSTNLEIEVKTISSENAWLVTNGEIRFELEQSDGQIIQTNICTVTVDLLNNVTFTGNTFSIDTSQLGTGTYFLKMYCTFNRGEWSSETTHSYAFGVNRPITVMDEFGYLSSWYKWKGNVKLSSDYLYLFNNSNSLTLMGDVDLTFTIGTSFAFNAVQEMTGTVTIELQDSSGNIIPINGNNKHTSNIRVGLASNVSISNSSFTINISDFADDTYTLRLDCRMTRGSTTYNNSDTYSFSVRNETCVAQGAMITLADGTQKAVEDLTGDEQLLVWNMMTGQFDTAPILFIDSDEQRFYQVVNLYFSDGTSVKVIGEHAFWNKDLNEYVFLRKDADQYIGDSFIKQTTNDNGEMVSSEVLLIDVVVTMEHTTAWSPVTYGHLCYYVNGMLSMPGATEGLINIFEVDPDAMRYDEEAMNQDIATYGLFTYEEFNALIPVPEEIFEAFNGQYLKVSIGKGYTSIEELAQLIERYSQFF